MWRVLGAGLTFVLMFAAPAGAQVPAGMDWHEEYLRSADGTSLHADVFRKAGTAAGERQPVIVEVTPYANPAQDCTLPAPECLPAPQKTGPVPPPADLLAAGLVEQGYTYVEVSLRGFGASAGCTDFMGRGEQADSVAAVEWAAGRPWSTGRVGMWGISYDGWTQMAAIAGRARGLRAAVVASPLIATYRGVFMNGVSYLPQLMPLVTENYDYGDLNPPPAVPAQLANSADPTALQPNCYSEQTVGAENGDPGTAFWRERDLIARASGSRVPVLLSHGFRDNAVHPDNFLDVWSALRGPHRAWLGQFKHEWGAGLCYFPPDGPPPGYGIHRCGFLDEATDWLDCYLKRNREACRAARRAPRVEVEDGDGAWRTERRWPPRDVTTLELAVTPGSYADAPLNNGEGGGSAVPGDTASGTGTWTLGAPLAGDTRVAGVPRLSANVETQVDGATLIAIVYDVAPDGNAVLVTRGAKRLGASGRVIFDLYPQDWRFAAGHRIGLLLTGSDDQWFTPGLTQTTVTVAGGTLSLPALAGARQPDLEGTLSEAARARRPIVLAG
jgi:predicted acyl esterase